MKKSTNECCKKCRDIVDGSHAAACYHCPCHKKGKFRPATDKDSSAILHALLNHKGFAAAFAKGDLQWHENEWKEFIAQIRSDERAEVLKEIEEWGKNESQKWVKCEDENCGLRVECERANYYIETIWTPHINRLLSFISSLKKEK